MELVSASDLFVTASLAILLSLLVAKLVSLATTDTQTATKEDHHAHDEPAGPVLQEDRLTVQTESRIGFVNPVQVATNVETGQHELIEEQVAIESGSDVAVELTAEPPVQEEAAKPDDGSESEDQRNAERGGEIIEEEATADPVVEGGEKSDDEWEWEGIERSELEEAFMAATGFVARNGCGGGGGSDDGGSDLQMELYGLHKVATEGPCRDSQPMPLMLSARAKWYQILTSPNHYFPLLPICGSCYALLN